MKLLVTGGAGFIGSNFVARRVAAGDELVVLDKLTYAGHLENLSDVMSSIRFVEGDICDASVAGELVSSGVDAIINFAAESHVDRSISNAREFVRTNIDGTRTLLDAAVEAGGVRFCQVSTDEVYGSADPGEVFGEESRLRPSSPYSASKAAADLVAMSYHRTHGLPVLITRCTNNYGPRQYPEKLIPLFVMKALRNERLPLYGDGMNERDWLHVEDHCAALDMILAKGCAGEIYNIGANNPVPNKRIVDALLGALGKPSELIEFVKDRPAHDRRYAVDTSKIRGELGWKPAVDLETGMARTIQWYRDNIDWVRAVTGPEFEEHCRALYGDRGGQGR